MKDRLKELRFIYKSILSPFGATVVKPWEGAKVEYEELAGGKDSGPVHFTENGSVVIPDGASVRVNFERRGKRQSFKIDDYRERTGNTPGAKVAGKFMKFDLDAEVPRLRIPGVGVFTYKGKDE